MFGAVLTELVQNIALQSLICQASSNISWLTPRKGYDRRGNYFKYHNPVTKGSCFATWLYRLKLVLESMTDTQTIDNITKHPIPLILEQSSGMQLTDELNYCTSCLVMNSSSFNFSGGVSQGSTSNQHPMTEIRQSCPVGVF